MIKIFQYECKRLLWNKFFFGLLLVILFYGWQVLNSVTILGVSHTAPFSAWSFGDYLSRMLPLLWIGALFFLTFFTSGKARRVAVLTDATPVAPGRYALTRCAAALVGTGLLALACLAEAAVFYGRYFGWYGWGTLHTSRNTGHRKRRYFGWYGWGTLLLPALVTLVPSLVFALGSGWLLGLLRPWLLYAWMPVPFLLSVLPLPEFLGLLNGSIFLDRPLSFDILDPAFSLPIGTIAMQCVLFLVGIGFLIICPFRNKTR